MKILITGANGQLAKSVAEVFYDEELILLSKKKLDVLSKKDVYNKIIKHKPDIVFHFASMTRGDECAKDPKKAYAVNVIGTKNVVDVCKKFKIQLLFISTNEVFNGKKTSPYTEFDKPNPETVVGMTKYKAEKYIKKNMKKYYIVRTSWLYSKWSSNFIHAIFKKALKEKKIKLVSDEISSPTFSRDLAIALKKLLTTKKYGIYHISNRGAVSRLEFGKMAFYLKKIDKIKITSVTLESFSRISKPPRYTPLMSKKINKIGIEMPDWKTGLQNYFKSEL